MHHGIATAIASHFLNRRRHRKEFLQRDANLAILQCKMHRIFHRKMHRNRNVSLPQSKRDLFPRKNHCVRFDRVNWKKGKDPHPKARFSIRTLLRNPSRFTTRPLPVHFTTKMSVVRPFSALSKDEIGP